MRMAGPPLDNIDHVLSTTRAVRKRLDLERPVEPAVIAECLRLAVAGADRQQHPELAVRGGHRPELRAAIGDVLPAWRRADYLAAGVGRARTDQQRRVASTRRCI